jgi:hypothetical protein
LTEKNDTRCDENYEGSETDSNCDTESGRKVEVRDRHTSLNTR